MDAIPTKQCSKCKEIKDINQYHTDRSQKDSLCTVCKPCQRIVRLKSQRKKREYKLAIESGREEDLIEWELKYCPVIDNSTKECTKCKQIKPRNAFYKNGRNKNGLSSWCIDCNYARQVEYMALPFDEAPPIKTCNGCKMAKELACFNKDKSKKDGYRSQCDECRKNCRFKSKFGITLEDYKRMEIEQSYQCAICNKNKSELYNDYRTGKPLALAVDHCHKTGMVRGLLCSDCNTALGLLKDDIDLLLKSIEYLNKNKKPL